jgi:hypothetical protein
MWSFWTDPNRSGNIEQQKPQARFPLPLFGFGTDAQPDGRGNRLQFWQTGQI